MDHTPPKDMHVYRHAIALLTLDREGVVYVTETMLRILFKFVAAVAGCMLHSGPEPENSPVRSLS
jgi:hypothetical protein